MTALIANFLELICRLIQPLAFLLAPIQSLLAMLKHVFKSLRSALIFLGMIAMIGMLFFLIYKDFFKTENRPYHLAFVGPLSGEGDAAGKQMTRAIDLYLEQLNKRGGVKEHKIVLDLFDDKNDPAQAHNQAVSIAQKNQALAVIGHWYSSCSISGGEVYKNYQIPAMTPGSVNIKVTQDNPWYFRNIYNASASGQFLANYVKQIFQQNTVTIIHEDAAYGSYLANVFEETSRKLGLEVKHKWMFKTEDKNIDRSLEKIVSELKTKQEAKEDAGVILLAVQALEGVKLVKLIKDAGLSNVLMGESSFSEQTFLHGFDEFPREKASPGYYTNDIYVATPLLFDTANEQAQQFREAYKARYHETPDWSAAYAYDSIHLIVEALKNSEIQGRPETLKEDRQKLRDALAKIDNARDAILGVTGFNYFDEGRDAQKPVALGVYKNRNIISALTQLQVIRNLKEIYNLDAAVKDGSVVIIDDKHMYKTNIVYTGVEINEISELDFKKYIHTLDFTLWFRYQGAIKPQDIEFTNAAEPIKIEAPVIDQVINNITYRQYRIKGKFKMDFLPSHHSFKQHVLGMMFRHRELTRSNLVYVTDELGMGLNNGDYVLQKLQSPQVFSPSFDWTIDQASFFQDISKKDSFGDPRYAQKLDGAIEYSRFNTGILIKESEFALSKLVPHKFMSLSLVLSAIVSLLLIVASKHPRCKGYSKLIWFFQVLTTFALLLSTQIVVVDKLLEEQVSTHNLEVVLTTFQILWWMIPAWLLRIAAERFLWIPLEEKTKRTIPNIIRMFLAFMLYFLGSVGVVAFVFDQQLTSILATSGVLAMIIGLAIQINISNIFSGIAINIERPFRVGDWVKIGDNEEGKVVDITWRTTRIKLRNECILSIPNSAASESKILNYCYPDDVYWLWPTVHVDESHSPERVKKLLLDAVLSADKICRDPAPQAIFTGIEERGASYWVAFCTDDYDNKFYILEDVWTRIWLHLNRAGIKPAIQRQEVHMFRGVKERGDDAAKPLTLLHEVEIFRPLSEVAKLYLSQRMRRKTYAAGDTIVHQGDEGNSLFIVVEGVVSVRVNVKDSAAISETTEVARLGSGNFFGEMALLTGADRTATVVSMTETVLFEITKADIAPVMAKQPAISELFSKVLTQRRLRTSSKLSLVQQLKDAAQRKEEEDTLRERIRNQIQHFFGLKK